jgi:hypothetical protein
MIGFNTSPLLGSIWSLVVELANMLHKSQHANYCHNIPIVMQNIELSGVLDVWFILVCGNGKYLSIIISIRVYILE